MASKESTSRPHGLLECGCSARCRGADYHMREAGRIQRNLDRLGPEFAPDGPVRWILLERIKQEKSRGNY